MRKKELQRQCDSWAITVANLRNAERDSDALNTLVNRAEGALYTLGEWYCADVGCKHCRVRRGCEAPQRVADAAYRQAVEDECDE